MRSFVVIVLTIALALVSAGTVAAQARTSIEVTRADIQADRQAIVAGNLPLSEAEAASFWPVYREYRAEMDKVGDKAVKTITDYATNYDTLTDEQASKLVSDSMEVQKAGMKVKEKYLPKFNQVLSGKSVMRFYQIENKLDTIVMMNLVAQIPLAK